MACYGVTERQLTKAILEYLQWIPNSSWKKIRGTIGMRGILDIIGCWQGRYVELEIKTERGRLTPWQKARLEEVRQAGGIAEVIRSVEDVHKLFGTNRIQLK